MKTALIGYTGFVGSSLRAQRSFEGLFNSANFQDMAGQSFDLMVCAGLPATKWKINQDPQADWTNILKLQSVLERVTAKEFVLISTIDVYPGRAGWNEDAPFPALSEMNAYGYHRLLFECFTAHTFSKTAIVRLPGLFGAGLKKNVIFDLLNNNALEVINPESIFQWYPTARLWRDIETVREAGLRVCNLFPEPIPTARILAELFPGKQVGQKAGPAITYDMHTQYGALFDCSLPNYMDTAEGVLEQLTHYVRHEATVPRKAG